MRQEVYSKGKEMHNEMSGGGISYNYISLRLKQCRTYLDLLTFDGSKMQRF